jgi:hypothetical protein
LLTVACAVFLFALLALASAAAPTQWSATLSVVLPSSQVP